MKKVNSDRVVSISAILVSIATLIMILYQTNLMRKEQKASVMPSLVIGYSVNEHNNEITEKIWLSNRGLGPAFIEGIVIIDKEKVYETDPFGYLVQTNANEGTKTVNRLYPGRIVPAKDGVELYVKQIDSTSRIIISNLFEFPYDIQNMPTDNKEKLIIEIIYRSIYDDKWKIRSDMSSPVEVD